MGHLCDTWDDEHLDQLWHETRGTKMKRPLRAVPMCCRFMLNPPYIMCLIQSPCWARYPNFAESLLRSAESNPALFVPRCSSRLIQKLLVWSRKPNSKFNFSPDQSTCLSLADSSPIYLDIHQFARSHKKKSFPIEQMAFAAHFKMSIPYMPYIYIWSRDL